MLVSVVAWSHILHHCFSALALYHYLGILNSNLDFECHCFRLCNKEECEGCRCFLFDWSLRHCAVVLCRLPGTSGCDWYM